MQHRNKFVLFNLRSDVALLVKMAQFIETFKNLQRAFACNNFPSFCLKPKQVQCFDFLLRGFDVITVLPTGFGKSLLFQLLPDFMPVKGSQTIVLVVSGTLPFQVSFNTKSKGLVVLE